MLRHVLGWVGWGGDVNVHVNLQHTRMLRHVLGWVGWGGDVNVHVNLRHTRMLRHVLGSVGWGGMLTFMWTCDTRACYVTSWVGWGGYWKEISASRKGLKTKGSWFTQVEWMQCGGCLNQPFHVALRPGWTATSILNWCEASGFGNGVGKAPKKMFWRKQVACCRSAWKAERGK